MRHRALAAIVSVALLSASAAVPASTQAQNAPTPILIDAALNRHEISPLIYGVNYGSAAVLDDLNCAINRRGGTPTSTYNWEQNAENVGADYYFESLARNGAQPGAVYDSFINESRASNAVPYVTMPMLNWAAKLAPGRNTLSSFSVAKYGTQQATDPFWPDFGNGVHPNGQFVTWNDPDDAMMAVDHTFHANWVRHLVTTFGPSGGGGVRYYGLDNEPSIWFESHRDVAPIGLTTSETIARTIDYASMIRTADPNAVILGPEEWGWSAYFYSGYDQWRAHRFGDYSFPDHAAHGGIAFSALYLSQLRQHELNTGVKLIDVFAQHYYPQGGEFSNDVSTAMQLRRNRSTRALWDPNYTDESWIDDQVKLIPRMKDWVNDNYPGLKIGLTEYNWGAESHINGATAQADILGILGREGVDVALRWVAPEAGSPVYNAMKLYRNYDGAKSAFGDVSIAAAVPDPDTLAAFAAQRSSDQALTVMVVSKTLSGAQQIDITLENFPAGATAEVYQLTSANAITRLADATLVSGALRATVPAQSITLFVIPRGEDPPAPDPAAVTVLTPNGGERFRGGKSYVLAWRTDNADVEDIESQDIHLSTDGGVTFPSVVATGLSGDTRGYRFRVAAAGARQRRCRIRVTCYLADGTTITDMSDANFQIR